MIEPEETTPKTLRQFGLILAVILALMARRAFAHSYPRALPEAAAALVCAALAWSRPRWLGALYRPWMRVATAVGAVNAYVILALIYYLLLTPYAWLVRLIGGDILDLKLRTGESYWMPSAAAVERERYERQF